MYSRTDSRLHASVHIGPGKLIYMDESMIFSIIVIISCQWHVYHHCFKLGLWVSGMCAYRVSARILEGA